MKIETRRLLFHPITLADLNPLTDLWSDSAVMRYLPSGQPRSPRTTRKIVEGFVQHWQEKKFGPWALTLKENKKFIGYCGLLTAANAPEIELLYGIAKACWGMGIANEAARAVLKWGFEAIGLEKITAAVVPENVASKRILEGLGMESDPSLNFYGPDVLYYSLSRSKFLSSATQL
jgi:ribosomal-protein-alanine N-acetyltransferase